MRFLNFGERAEDVISKRSVYACPEIKLEEKLTSFGTIADSKEAKILANDDSRRGYRHSSALRAFQHRCCGAFISACLEVFLGSR